MKEFWWGSRAFAGVLFCGFSLWPRMPTTISPEIGFGPRWYRRRNTPNCRPWRGTIYLIQSSLVSCCGLFLKDFLDSRKNLFPCSETNNRLIPPGPVYCSSCCGQKICYTFYTPSPHLWSSACVQSTVCGVFRTYSTVYYISTDEQLITRTVYYPVTWVY